MPRAMTFATALLLLAGATHAADGTTLRENEILRKEIELVKKENELLKKENELAKKEAAIGAPARKPLFGAAITRGDAFDTEALVSALKEMLIKEGIAGVNPDTGVIARNPDTGVVAEIPGKTTIPGETTDTDNYVPNNPRVSGADSLGLSPNGLFFNPPVAYHGLGPYQASLVGKSFAPAIKFPATRRRMLSEGYTKLANVSASVCDGLKLAMWLTGDLSANIMLNDMDGYDYAKFYSGYLTDMGNSSAGEFAHVKESGVYDKWYLVKKLSDGNCEVSEPVSPGRRLRQLELTELDHGLLSDRRRLSSHLEAHVNQSGAGIAASVVDTRLLHLDEHECMVYHCFEGDEDCPDPAPAYACLVHNDDGSCKLPACKWLVEHDNMHLDPNYHSAVSSGAIPTVLSYRRSRQLADNTYPCASSAACRQHKGQCITRNLDEECVGEFCAGPWDAGFCTDGSRGDPCGSGVECSRGKCDSGRCAVCLAKETTEACRLTDPAAAATLAYEDCFGSGTAQKGERVLMSTLKSGDFVLTADASGPAVTRVILNFHRMEQKTAEFLTLHYAAGSITASPSHQLLIDGRMRPATEATVGAYLVDGTRMPQVVTRISVTKAGIINAHTVSGTILAADVSSTTPVVASVFASDWAREVLHGRLLRLNTLVDHLLPASCQEYVRETILQGLVDSPLYTLGAQADVLKDNLEGAILALVASPLMLVGGMKLMRK